MAVRSIGTSPIGRGVPRLVQLDKPVAEGGTALRTVAPEQRPDPRLELGEVERLDQVVVGSLVQPADSIVQRITCGEHQHPGWLVAEYGIGIGAHRPADLTAVDVGQVEVEAHQVVLGCGQPIQSPATVACDVHGIAVAPQPAGDRRRQIGLILHHQDPHIRNGTDR